MDKYIYWDEDLEIRQLADGSKVLKVYREFNDNMPNKTSKQTIYRLNDTASEIVQLINGTRTYSDIISFLSEKYNEEYDSIKNKVTNFLNEISNAYSLKINTTKSPFEKYTNVVKKETIYPTVASIELTNKCNLRCKHCYGDFGNLTNAVMSLDNVKALLDDLKSTGVTIVELTGGELTVHPNIKEILLYAISLNFNQISILTNGVNLSDKLIDIIIENKSNLFVQIDLHSMNDEYLTWFTKVSNTLETVENNIIRLAKNNVRMRIATIITPKNLNEVEKIADWVHNLGIKHYGVSMVVPLGRAVGFDSDLILNQQETIHLEEILERINKKYENFLSLVDYDRSRDTNCGCLTSHCVISSDGNIKICTMDNFQYFNGNIGNVFTKKLKDIFDENSDYINAFFNMESPKNNSPECMNCKNQNFCSSCVLRGLIKAKELKDKCLWYVNKIPKVVKDRL